MSDHSTGPRIYNLFPLLAGPIGDWEALLPDIARMGFDWIFLNPFQRPGSSGSLYAVSDPYELHPVVRGRSEEDTDTLVARFMDRARDQGLSVMMDLVVNHTARDAPLVDQHPRWYARDADGAVRSPFAVNPQDPDDVTVWEDLAELDFRERPERTELLDYWDRVIAHYVRLGCAGFRCDAAYKVPGAVWEALIGTARSLAPETRFFAETLGAGLDEVSQLRPAGFDYFFNSAKWWDFRADWLLEQYERFRHLAPSIAFPESHDTERLAAAGGGERASRFWYLFAALFSSGVMMPMGYELGFKRPLHVVDTRPEDREEPAFDLRDFVAAVNAMKAEIPLLDEEGPQRRFTGPKDPVTGLLRRAKEGDARVVTLINPDPEHRRDFQQRRLAEALDCTPGEIREITPMREGSPASERIRIQLLPQTIRAFTI